MFEEINNKFDSGEGLKVFSFQNTTLISVFLRRFMRKLSLWIENLRHESFHNFSKYS